MGLLDVASCRRIEFHLAARRQGSVLKLKLKQWFGLVALAGLLSLAGRVNVWLPFAILSTLLPLLAISWRSPALVLSATAMSFVMGSLFGQLVLGSWAEMSWDGLLIRERHYSFEISTVRPTIAPRSDWFAILDYVGFCFEIQIDDSTCDVCRIPPEGPALLASLFTGSLSLVMCLMRRRRDKETFPAGSDDS